MPMVQIEGLIDGLNRNNSTDDKPNKDNPLEGRDAVNALKDMGLVG